MRDDIYTDFYPQKYTWYLVGFTWDGSKINIYVDGDIIETVDFNPSPQVNSHALEIGRHQPVDTEYMDGILDEIRISNIPRTSFWMKTSYNNQNNPSSFLSIGPEESGP